MMYNLPHGILKDIQFNSAPIRDCFSFLGLPCTLYADNTVAVKDRELIKSQEYLLLLYKGYPNFSSKLIVA